MRELLLGVDIGTSACKVAVFNREGEVIASGNGGYQVYYPHPGWAEQNPQDWWRAFETGILELLEDYDAKEVEGISFGGQMHGLVILDDHDEVIRPAILWNDGRTTKECDYLNNEIGKDKLTEYTANIAFAGFTAPKLLWVKNNEPDNFKKIAKIMLPKDYIAYRLTGVHCTDVSDASGMLLLDVKKRDWSEEMINICKISRKQLPALYESYEKVGCITKEAAMELGLPDNVCVAAGAGDNAAAAVGTGTVGDGMCNISLGTSGTIFISSSNFSVDNNALHSFDHADGYYHLMGCMLSAASCNGWWMDNILKDTDYKEAQSHITKDMLGNNHVYFLPYLMGERSPHNDPLARATFTGMTMDSTRTDMTQAVLEGVAFAIRDSFEIARSLGINITETKMCGGGAKSELWCTIMANVLGIKVHLLKSEEGPSMGAAMLAMVAAGEYENVKQAADSIVGICRTIEPEKDIADRYNSRYNTFKDIYPALKGVFEKM
mgnify:CR=1 FL=1